MTGIAPTGQITRPICLRAGADVHARADLRARADEARAIDYRFSPIQAPMFTYIGGMQMTPGRGKRCHAPRAARHARSAWRDGEFLIGNVSLSKNGRRP